MRRAVVPRGSSRRVDRRGFLARVAAGGVAAAALAGCAEIGLPGDDSPNGDEGPSHDVETLDSHPAARGIDEQPTLGPDPGTARGTIIAFEDPSCPSCATFHRETVSRIESELVASGEATYVSRGYPVVYDWGEPATEALWASFQRDADAHWVLLDHYFAEQSSFDEGNVLERTGEFLAAETDVDGGAVVADVRDGAVADAVAANLSAGRDAGAGDVTPTVFVFRDGTYRTMARGSASYDLIATALGL